MNEMKTARKLTMAGAVLAAAMMAGAAGYALIGQTTVASAQTTTDSTTNDGGVLDTATEEETNGKAKSKARAKGGATAEMICEAEQRTHARFKKWIEQGIPEQFGSEEPFTFDPSLCTTG